MRTRSGVLYPKRKRSDCWNGGGDHFFAAGAKRRCCAETGSEVDYLDALPDDIVVSILSKLSASAAAPSDLISVFITCKRMKELGQHELVLAKASTRALAVRAKNWSEPAQRFLKRCADLGNLEANYIFGMIRFYCLGDRANGAAMMARAAMGSHEAALHSLAVIQFNGSGGAKGDRDLRAGVALCARAAALGHVDALREIGHCLQDGYGVRRNVGEGRRFLVQANARELAAVLGSPVDAAAWLKADRCRHVAEGAGVGICPLLSDFGWNLPAAEPHPANRFLVEWFGKAGDDGLRLCSHAGCGRKETRRHEFRRCSVCGAVNYCSRACQALHWKMVHKAECVPMEQGGNGNAGAAAAAEVAAAPAAGDAN